MNTLCGIEQSRRRPYPNLRFLLPPVVSLAPQIPAPNIEVWRAPTQTTLIPAPATPPEVSDPHNVAVNFRVLRKRVPISGQRPGHVYSYEVLPYRLQSHQRIVWGNHRLAVFVGKGGGVLLRGHARSHKFRDRRAAAEHLSRVMMRESGNHGFHTDIPFRLKDGGLRSADLGSLNAPIAIRVVPSWWRRYGRLPIPGRLGQFYAFHVQPGDVRDGGNLRGPRGAYVTVNSFGVTFILQRHAPGGLKGAPMRLSRATAAMRLSRFMDVYARNGDFTTNIPFYLTAPAGDLGDEDLGSDLGARDSFGRYKEYELAGDLVVRKYRKDVLRIMRTGGQSHPNGMPVPKNTPQHTRIMSLIAAEKAETKEEKKEARQERRKRAGGIAAMLVESAAAGAVKGLKSKPKKGKKGAAVESEEEVMSPVEEPAPSPSGMPSWLLPVGILSALGAVVAIAVAKPARDGNK